MFQNYFKIVPDRASLTDKSNQTGLITHKFRVKTANKIRESK